MSHDAEKWDSVPVVATHDALTPAAEGDAWFELEPNGWGAMLAWFIGPPDLRRSVDDRPTYWRVIEVTDGINREHLEPSTHEDLGIDDDVDNYLAAAGIPARPHGYRWFARLPKGVTEQQFRLSIGQAVKMNWPPSNHPSDIAQVVSLAVKVLYEQKE